MQQKCSYAGRYGRASLLRVINDAFRISVYTASCYKRNSESSFQNSWNGTLWLALSEISGIRRRHQEDHKNFRLHRLHRQRLGPHLKQLNNEYKSQPCCKNFRLHRQTDRQTDSALVHIWSSWIMNTSHSLAVKTSDCTDRQTAPWSTFEAAE